MDEEYSEDSIAAKMLKIKREVSKEVQDGLLNRKRIAREFETNFSSIMRQEAHMNSLPIAKIHPNGDKEVYGVMRMENKQRNQ